MHPTQIRRLIRKCRGAALATALTADAGRPYASLVTTACDVDASPLLLLSDLADHARNIAEDPRASLLFDGTRGFANPQEGPRVSLVGRIERADIPKLRARFLARHPAAALYADFADFHLYRMRVEHAHAIGGFARAAWLAADRFIVDAAVCAAFNGEPLSATIEALNAAGTANIARRGVDDKSPDEPADRVDAWRIAALDPDGADLVRGEETRRITFAEPLEKPGAAVDALRNFGLPGATA